MKIFQKFTSNFLFVLETSYWHLNKYIYTFGNVLIPIRIKDSVDFTKGEKRQKLSSHERWKKFQNPTFTWKVKKVSKPNTLKYFSVSVWIPIQNVWVSIQKHWNILRCQMSTYSLKKWAWTYNYEIISKTFACFYRKTLIFNNLNHLTI